MAAFRLDKGEEGSLLGITPADHLQEVVGEGSFLELQCFPSP